MILCQCLSFPSDYESMSAEELTQCLTLCRCSVITYLLTEKRKDIGVWSPFYRQRSWGWGRLTCLSHATGVSITVPRYKQQKPTLADLRRKRTYGKPIGQCTESPGRPRLTKWAGTMEPRWRVGPRPKWCLRSSLVRTWLTSLPSPEQRTLLA